MSSQVPFLGNTGANQSFVDRRRVERRITSVSSALGTESKQVTREAILRELLTEARARVRLLESQLRALNERR